LRDPRFLMLREQLTMKTLWIASISALALAASPAHAGGDSKQKHHDRPAYGPAMGPDRGVYDMNGSGAPTWSDADGSRYDYQGEWTKGRYVDSEGRVYEGQWNGTVTRNGEGPVPYPAQAGAPYPYPPQAGAPYPALPAYSPRGGYDRYERCLKSQGVAGGAIGAIIGGIAGNRIAGRGNRTEGSLIGAGLGALAGLGIEKSMKRCEKYLPEDGGSAHGYPGHGGYPTHGGYPQGYYYYYPQPVMTYQMVPVTTTTVTEEVYYETVPVKRKAVRKWKPKPRAKPRCVCR
jgi:hypothetical protein